MAIYAISDLHLSFNKYVDLYNIDSKADIEKPMEKFGWNRHYDLIRDNWLSKIKECDTVLIPGDISWAMRLDVAQFDFHWINQLPGKKVLSPGNHCYYVQSKKKMREFLPGNMEWLDADFAVVENRTVCATRGWILPGDRYFNSEVDMTIYRRQAGRLRLALVNAQKNYPDMEKWVMLHYPPITKTAVESLFMDIMKEFNVTLCIYGHLHGTASIDAIEGKVDNIELKLVSCDALNFSPVCLSAGL